MSIETTQALPLEPPDGVRVLFTAPDSYVAGSLWVYVGGARVIVGSPAVVEVPPNQLLFAVAPAAALVIDLEYQVSP